jgi:hypothetical protein
MKYKSRGKKGQFSIIAALLVAIIMVSAVIMIYSSIRNLPFQESPKVLNSVEEMNTSLKQLLEFAVGYYGSVLQVTGNFTYAKNLTSTYLQSGFDYIAHSYPQWNPSFTVYYSNFSTLWYTSSSYSMGNLSVQYSLSGIGVNQITYKTSSLLEVAILATAAGQSKVLITREDGMPDLTLGRNNFFFYTYSNSTWQLINPTTDPVVYSNGTYILQIPSGVDQSSYLIKVSDLKGVMATAFFSNLRAPECIYSFTWDSRYSSLTKDTVVVEALQNGTLRWLGQNLQLSTNGKPILPLPVKALHVNETIGGISREVPFQVEDWGSNYRVPLGLASNASLFGDRQMIVFLVNHNVQKVTIWWNGQDTATQTSYAWTCRYFTGDNPSARTLTNGILTLTISSDYSTITSSMTGGSITSTANFLRINTRNPTYGSGPAYVIYKGIVRDIVQQEAEWSNGITNCPNVYSQIYLTLPANATYYTYASRLIFINSAAQPRTINDLSAIQLSVSGGSLSPSTENGTNGGNPIASSATGNGFYNLTSAGFQTGWAHHWSEFISGSSGAGIMFTNNTNQKLYTFDNIAGQKTGALNVINTAGWPTPTQRIEFNPVARSSYPSFTYPLDVTWHGAVVTFNDAVNTIYPTSGNIGLWVMVENPPKISLPTINNVSITVTSSPSGSGYVKVDGNPITTPYTFTWTAGSSHTLQALSPIAGPAGTRYVWTGWSDGGAQNHTYTVPASDTTIAANWQTQYQVTFNYQVSGGGSGYSAPSVTYYQSGSQLSVTAGPSATVWVDSGSTYTYTNPLTGSGAGERWYASSGASGTISSSTTINPTYYHQYYLTVSSAYGSPTGQGWYNAGSSANFGVTTPASGGTGIQYIFTSWSGFGSGSYSGTSSSYSVTMNNPITETANWQTQYYLTVNNGGHGTASGQGWYNAGSSATFSISPTTLSGGTGIQYLFTSWSGSGLGSYSGTSSSYSVTMNNPITETANWLTQYQVTFNWQVSGGGSGYSAPSVNYTSLGSQHSLTAGPTATVWVDSGSTYTYTNPLTGSGASERWYASSGASGTISSSTTINPTYYHQYKVTFDASSNVKGDSSATIVTVAGTGYTGAQLPCTNWFNAGSLTYSYASPIGSSSSSTIGYYWSSTSGLGQTLQSNTFTLGGTGTITATYTTQTFGIDTNCEGFGSVAGGRIIITSSMTAQANELIIVVITGNSYSPTVSSITDSFGTHLTYTSEVSYPSFFAGQCLYVYYALTGTHTGSFTITVTMSVNYNYCVQAFGITGANTATPFDTNYLLPATNSQNYFSAPTVYGVSTSNANDMILAFEGQTSSTTQTAGPSFTAPPTLLHNVNNLGNNVEYEIVTSTQSYITVSFGTSVSSWIMAVDAVQRGW